MTKGVGWEFVGWERSLGFILRMGKKPLKGLMQDKQHELVYIP